MDNISNKPDEEFDFEKLPEGLYYFSGEEGFVSVQIDKKGIQHWNLENWFANLDPDKNEIQRNKVIEDIKQRINTNTGKIKPIQKRKNLFKRFYKLIK